MSRNIVCSIYRSLCAFSKESENVLQYLEQHDYSCERNPWPADKRVIETPDCPSLDSLTRRLLRYRTNYIDDDNPIPEEQLLDLHNIRLCVEYFNRSKDDRLAQTFQDIPRYSIQQVGAQTLIRSSGVMRVPSSAPQLPGHRDSARLRRPQTLRPKRKSGSFRHRSSAPASSLRSLAGTFSWCQLKRYIFAA